MIEAQYYPHQRPATLITSGGLGTMGFGLPAAIGAKFGRPDEEVWAIVGDGGFQMTLCELATAKQENVNINIAIINNAYLGMVRQWQEFFYEERYHATPMFSPDFVKLAEAYGIPAMRVTSRDQIEEAVEFARSVDGPALIEFVVEKEEVVYPMVPAGADLRQHDPPPEAGRGKGEGAEIMAEHTQPQKHILVALVENKPGVLNRVASLFRRRNFNVDSLTVGRTHKPHMSRMTIVVNATRTDARRIAANLFKLINVIDVAEVSSEPHVSRDLALIKVRANDADSRNNLTLICDRYPAHIVDIGPEVAIVEIAAQEDLVEALIEELKPQGIVELVRTGVVAMGRGVRILDSPYEPVDPGYGEWSWQGVSGLQRLSVPIQGKCGRTTVRPYEHGNEHTRWIAWQ